MGLQFDTYVFKKQYPNIEEIIKKACEISGLEIIKIKPRISINAYLEGYHDYSYELAFKDFQKNSVEVYTYKNEKDNHISNKERQEMELRVARFEEQKTVNLQNYMGQESTLFDVISLALKELGGVSPYENLKSDIVVNYPTSIEQLKKKQKKHTLKSFLLILLTILLIPIIIPINLLIIIFGILKAPFVKLKK